MLPRVAQLIEGHRWFCRAHRIPCRDPEAVDLALDDACRVAASLAGDHAPDEPAALLFALTLKLGALGDAWAGFPVVVAGNLAVAALGAELRLDRADQIALENLRLRAVSRRSAFEDPRTSHDERRAIFEELRAFVTTRLRPLR
jgi:hypothetical protein